MNSSLYFLGCFKIYEQYFHFFNRKSDTIFRLNQGSTKQKSLILKWQRSDPRVQLKWHGLDPDPNNMAWIRSGSMFKDMNRIRILLKRHGSDPFLITVHGSWRGRQQLHQRYQKYSKKLKKKCKALSWKLEDYEVKNLILWQNNGIINKFKFEKLVKLSP